MVGTRRKVWRWISLATIPAAVVTFAAVPWDPPVSLRSYPLDAKDPLPASLYFGAAESVLGPENRESISAIVRALKNSPKPVVITAYAPPSGNRAQNIRLARRRVSDVRDALVMAGVPTLQVVVVSPALAASDAAGRIEISSGRGVQAFPAHRIVKASERTSQPPGD